MAADLKKIEERLLQLDPQERATLAHRLLESLDTLSDEEKERLWAAIAERRYGQYLEGNVSSIDGDAVFAEARSRNRP
jgi:hypothetical protein